MEQLNQSSLRESIDSVITPELTKLTGFIFNYDDRWLNKSLFIDYLWVDFESNDDIDSFIAKAEESLEIKRSNFASVQAELESEGEAELWTIFSYYKENFEKISMFFRLLSLYIPIEARKISGVSFVDDGTLWWFSKEDYIVEIERIESNVFWKKLSDRPESVVQVLDYIINLFESSENLSPDEQVFMSDIIAELISRYPLKEQVYSNAGEKNSSDEKELLLEDPLDIENKNDHLDVEISQEKYVKVFSKAIEILGIDVDVVVWNYPNFSVDPGKIWEKGKLKVPQKVKTLKVSRIIALIAHELERHAVWNQNNKHLVWNLKSLSYLGQEEWVAHIMEHLALGYNLDEMPLNRYMPRMLVGELFGGATYKRFLEVFNKLDNAGVDPEVFYVRSKRGKDHDLPGVNPKEKLYGIWALEIIDRLRSGESPLWFFLAKNWTSEQDQINDMILDWGDGEITPELLEDKHVVLPLMLWELLRYEMVSGDDIAQKWMYGWFIKYFNTRYGDIFDSFWISYRDFIGNHIRWMKNQNRKKVEEILEILRS